MTERLSNNPRLWALLAALCVAVLGSALGGCAHEDYYCDSTGCFYCDGVGCRMATPPTRPTCRGDFECASGQICTNLGCTAHCRVDSDCAHGWVCRGGSGADAGSSDGVCVTPTEPNPTPNPGSCTTNADCAAGTVCIDGACHTSPSPTCSHDSDCTGGQVCVAGRCTAPSDTCQFDNQCGQGRVCVNSQCQSTCGGAMGCPTGESCVTSGTVMYCAPNQSPMCVQNSDCGAGKACLNGVCYQSCTSGSASCGSSDLYCSDDNVCVPDTRPRPFCDATHPCAAGSNCVGGVCRVPCTSNMQCQMVDINYRNCGQVPNQSDTRSYCLTDHEVHALCSRQSDCAQGQSCIDGSCQ